MPLGNDRSEATAADSSDALDPGADASPDAPMQAPASAATSFKVVDLVDVSVTLPDQHATVLLTEAAAPYRSLSFPMGLAEAAALSLAQGRTESRRPLTHELFSETLRRLNVDIVAMRITRREAGVLYAELDLMSPRGREIMDCRPSDALVLCLRQMVPAPLLVDESLFDQS